MPLSPDSARSYYLYRYLLCRLAIERKRNGVPKNQPTATRVGRENLRKVLPALLKGKDEWEKTIPRHKQYETTTTGTLVEMLAALRSTLEQEYKSYNEPHDRVLTTEDILTALYQLIELTPSERKSLGLPTGDRLTLLKQTLLSLQVKDKAENYEAVFRAYKEAVGLGFAEGSTAITSLDQVNDLIEASVRDELSHLPFRASRHRKNSQYPYLGSEETIIELSRKAQREVRRLLVRSGNTHPFFEDRTAAHPYISSYLQAAFVKKLSQTVVKNERLTAQLPVFLSRLTIESKGPLPFSDTGLGPQKFSRTYPPLLDNNLRDLDGNAEYSLSKEIPNPSDYELAAQEAMKITLGFYIKMPPEYPGVIPKTFKALVSDTTEGPEPYRRVDFTYSSTGVGGTLSHIVKVINTTLLSGIPCLAEFFPIAHDVTSTQTLIRDNVPSPVWAHSLVKLCNKQSLSEALAAFETDPSFTYNDFSFGDPIGDGDFCGFDFLRAQAQSSLNARLRAILNTGIDPSLYIKELCEKVEQQVTLQQAWQRLKNYPFSSMAMIGTIHEAILDPVFKTAAAEKPAPKLHANNKKIYFDAYLSISEALLGEGAYRAAYQNLKQIEILDIHAREGLRPSGGSDRNSDALSVLSSSLIIRYLICKANYYYLYDLKEKDSAYWEHEFPAGIDSRQQLVAKSWETLNLAQKHIQTRLEKYVVIGEISQGTFNPHYNFLSRIYLLRARLLTFFPALVPRSDDLLPTEDFSGRQRTAASIHWGKLFLLEKARLYTAADGDSEGYSYYAALQSCYYLTAAYEKPQQTALFERSTTVTRPLSREHCLMWAKRLRDHALLTYAQTGRQCYNAIKEKSGLPEKFDDHGRYRIYKLPAIFEDRGLQKGRTVSEDDEFLTLDISLLAISSEDLPRLTSNHPDSSLYLFGTNTCHIFLVRGLYLLCSDATEEFPKNEATENIRWNEKLSLAGRLFDLAWAVAEDGCTVKRDSKKRNSKKRDSKTRKKTITRTFKGEKDNTQYTSREINSVRDLYPRRMNEIADIGKLFSAACKVLQTYLIHHSERAELEKDIDHLFGMLHGEYRLNDKTDKSILKALLSRQKRYNGHLETFLLDAREAIESHRPEAKTAYPEEAIEGYRNHLMQDLFATLMK
ncbi:MAG: hypothetical protein AAGL08_16060 [Cyanobacteria bacterium J06573_11]